MLNCAPAVPAAIVANLVDVTLPTLSTEDSGRICVGAGWRLLPAVASTTDSGRIRIGAGWRLLAR